MPITTKDVIEYKEKIQRKELRLNLYHDAELTISYNSDSEDIYLEIGEEVYNPSSALTDEEIVDWAKENKEFEDDDDLDLEKLRSGYDDLLFGSSPSWTYPSGRAYDYFANLSIDNEIWNLLNVYLVDGEHPGLDWWGVQVENYESLVLLQWVLEKNGMKVNFELQTK